MFPTIALWTGGGASQEWRAEPSCAHFFLIWGCRSVAGGNKRGYSRDLKCFPREIPLPTRQSPWATKASAPSFKCSGLCWEPLRKPTFALETNPLPKRHSNEEGKHTLFTSYLFKSRIQFVTG